MAAVPAAASASTRAGAHPVHARREGVRRQRHLRARAAAQLLQGLPLREDRCGCAGEGSGWGCACGCGWGCRLLESERDGSGSGGV